MLSIFNRCDRREFLRVGSLGFGGLTLANLLASQAPGGTGAKPLATGKSVIFLLLHGGPTQHETFDPKPDVPEGIRTLGGIAQTSVPGVHFGSTLEKLARWVHRMALVRSYATGSSGHSLRPLVSETTGQANIGSYYSRLVGSNHPRSGIPTNVALFPNSVEPKALGPDLRFGKFSQTGDLGVACAPFAPGGGSMLQQNMQLTLSSERFDDRRMLLTQLDRLWSQMDHSPAGDVDAYRRQAIEMVLRGVASAFDISEEDPRTVARYDTADYVDETRYQDKSNGAQGRRWYQTNASTLGRQLLLARRLCERGCGFVTVATRFVWDMHADSNNLGISRGLEAVVRPFDHAVSAFIEDCEQRGLADDILLVCAGEMGRTPKINPRGGRDHWARLAPLMLYGGGITDGQVIGQSTRDGGEPLTSPLDTSHLVATILHTLVDIPELRLRSDFPTELARFATTAQPIPQLFR